MRSYTYVARLARVRIEVHCFVSKFDVPKAVVGDVSKGYFTVREASRSLETREQQVTGLR